MRLIKVGIANIDTTVGAIDSNVEKMIAAARKMHEEKCTVGVMPEQVIGGYPAEDLVLSAEFVHEQWRGLMRFVNTTRECSTVFVLGLCVRVSGFVYNASAVVHGGIVVGIVPKEHLPTYNVFYEHRVFTAGVPGLYRELPSPGFSVPFGDLIFEFPFGTLATCVCEDAWTPDGPLARRAAALIHCVPNASPARQGVWNTRLEMLSTRSADHECVLVSAYQVGGNDALVFDGGGFVFQNGQLIGDVPQFHEGVTTFEVDLSRTERMRTQNTTWRMRQEERMRKEDAYRTVRPDTMTHTLERPSREFAERYSFLPADKEAREQALSYLAETAVRGLTGYFEKIGAFKKILIALSGGKDSFLTLLLAWVYARRYVVRFPPVERNARLRELITCISMPTRFNSDETRSIARDICEQLGVNFVEDPIEEAVALEVEALQRISGKEPDTTTLGNIQARIRGERMWNLANVEQGLWLQTGNMSERAVGYTTIGGDLMGGYSLIGNLPKTVVTELIAYLAKTFDISAERILETRASAELAEGQFDEDELMPFPVLDLCFLLFAGEWYGPADMYRVLRARWTDEELREMRPGFEPHLLKSWIERFVHLFRTSIFKWVQAPQSVHLGSLDLDRERALQIPVVTSPEWLKRSLAEMRELA